MIRTETYKCEKEECSHTFEIEGQTYKDFPKRKTCPKCKSKQSCFKTWQTASIVIPDHMKATNEGSGLDYARSKLKNYKGMNRDSKRFY